MRLLRERGYFAHPSPQKSCANIESQTGVIMTLRTDFSGDFSSSAFQTIDGEDYIVGKCGRITCLGNWFYDCWFVGKNGNPLSGKKLSILARKCPTTWGFVRLSGEAYARGHGRRFVLEMAAICEVRKRRRVSEKERIRLQALKKAR